MIPRRSAAAALAVCTALAVFPAAAREGLPSPDAFRTPDARYRPETWFHVIGRNHAREGLDADLRAIADAGLGGIQFFHGHFSRLAQPDWPGTSNDVRCLSAEWDEMLGVIANTCRARNLTFKLQNCPGWATSGGPWIRPENAMRGLRCVRADVTSDGRAPVRARLPIDVHEPWRDWRDIAVVAFPALADDGETVLRPVSVATNGNSRVYAFDRPVTIRTLRLPAPRRLNARFSYRLDTRVRFAAADGADRVVAETAYPTGCWMDEMPFSLACRPETARVWRLTVESPHVCNLADVSFSPATRLDNWEGLAGWVIRGASGNAPPEPAADRKIDPARLRVFPAVRGTDGLFSAVLPEGRWTVLRFAHVNLGETNGPAPEEATGWECDKLDPRGAEAHFAGYVGRLAEGPLAGRGLSGMIIDSWECARQTWTERMPDFFRRDAGYDLLPRLPALFGRVIGDTAATRRFLSDWRRVVAGLVDRNYYRRMAELAHGKGLSIAYEMAFGHVLPGDPLAYYRHADTPMCEFWQPFGKDGGVSDNDFNPVRPCSSAAHLYGKTRAAAEAFPSLRLTWQEDFNLLKSVVDRRYGYGVTHCVLHTFTHNPLVGAVPPGTSLGRGIGTPFSRLQTWWRYMPGFTRYLARCARMLEAGRPVVDVLLYLGDDPLHIPSEDIPFPAGYKYDYLNRDALFTRLSVRGRELVTPDGTAYRAVWLPAGCDYGAETAARLAAIEKAGVPVLRGTPSPTWVPDLVSASPVHWYHRTDGRADWYFVSAPTGGFRGEIAFRAQGPADIYDPVSGAVRPAEKRGGAFVFDLAPAESLFVVFRPDAAPSVPPARTLATVPVDGPWRVAFTSGPGAPSPRTLGRLLPWRLVPGLSAEERAFSGTARYETAFTLADGACAGGGALWLDLGEVGSFADVEVNGRSVASLWCRPYRCDIAAVARPGTNTLAVTVTSPWGNRLIFDAGRDASARATWTYPWPSAGRPPADYGLKGPVRVRVTDAPSAARPPAPTRTDRIRARFASADRRHVFVAMHRGDCRNYPENSAEAIRSAIALGAEIVEVDVQRTKDGCFVLLHDATLDRTTEGKGRAEDFTLAELTRLRLRDRNGGPGERLTPSRVISLEEALAIACGRILVNIDNFASAPREILEAVIRAGAVRDVILKASFTPDEAKAVFGPCWALVERGELLFMPITAFLGPRREKGVSLLPLWLAESPLPPVFEMCFAAPEERRRRISQVRAAPGAPRVWVNTLTDLLSAGFGEVDRYTVSARKATRLDEPGLVWGGALDAGATVIQTDYAAELIVYLHRIGRRDPD